MKPEANLSDTRRVGNHIAIARAEALLEAVRAVDSVMKNQHSEESESEATRRFQHNASVWLCRRAVLDLLAEAEKDATPLADPDATKAEGSAPKNLTHRTTEAAYWRGFKLAFLILWPFAASAIIFMLMR